jgi:hypothetical protein
MGQVDVFFRDRQEVGLADMIDEDIDVIHFVKVRTCSDGSKHSPKSARLDWFRMQYFAVEWRFTT